MKIGIVGNYGNNNQGDEAILEGIIIQLENTFHITRNNILVFTNNPEQTKKMYGTDTAPLFIHKKTDPMKFIATIFHHRKIVRNLDLLLIGGGGILMDLYRNNPIVYGMYGILVKWTKTPAFIFGAGAGPITTKLGRFLIRLICNSTRHVLVRDEESKVLLTEIGVSKPIDIILDPAFYLEYKAEIQRSDEPYQIGVTAVPYFSQVYWPTEDKDLYNSYVSGMAGNLDQLLNENNDFTINFFSTRHPEDTTAAKDIRNKMTNKDRTKLYEQEFNHREILSFISHQDMIIGTRLHSLILALVAQKPIIAVSYHHKVKNVLDGLGCGGNVTEISDLNKSNTLFTDIYKQQKLDQEDYIDTYKSKVPEIRQTAIDGMQVIKKELKNLIS